MVNRLPRNCIGLICTHTHIRQLIDRLVCPIRLFFIYMLQRYIQTVQTFSICKLLHCSFTLLFCRKLHGWKFFHVSVARYFLIYHRLSNQTWLIGIFQLDTFFFFLYQSVFRVFFNNIKRISLFGRLLPYWKITKIFITIFNPVWDVANKLHLLGKLWLFNINTWLLFFPPADTWIYNLFFCENFMHREQIYGIKVSTDKHFQYTSLSHPRKKNKNSMRWANFAVNIFLLSCNFLVFFFFFFLQGINSLPLHIRSPLSIAIIFIIKGLIFLVWHVTISWSVTHVFRCTRMRLKN